MIFILKTISAHLALPSLQNEKYTVDCIENNRYLDIFLVLINKFELGFGSRFILAMPTTICGKRQAGRTNISQRCSTATHINKYASEISWLIKILNCCSKYAALVEITTAGKQKAYHFQIWEDGKHHLVLVAHGLYPTLWYHRPYPQQSQLLERLFPPLSVALKELSSI